MWNGSGGYQPSLEAWACVATEKAQTKFTSLRIIVADTVLAFISVKMYLFNKIL